MLLPGLVLGLAAPANAVDVWCASGLANVFRDTPPGPARVLHLAAARGQTVGGQVVLRSAGPAELVRAVRCSPLAGPRGRRIGPAAFAWAFVDYQHVDKNSKATPPEELARAAPADFPDALSEERERVLQAGQNQPVWVAISVPRNAAAGVYRGTVSVDLAAGPRAVPVELTVYDFSLPERPRLAVTVWINTDSLAKHQNVAPDSDAYWQVVRRTARLMRRHHQNTILTPWSLISAAREVEDALGFDFSRFDRWVNTFLGEGFERIEISHVGGREHGQWEDPSFVASTMPCANKVTGKTEQLTIEQWLPALEGHLRAKGWLSRSMIHVADEPIPMNVDSWKRLAARVAQAAPGIRRIDAIHVPDLYPDLQVLVPQLNYLEQWLGKFEDEQRKGAELWFYTAWVPQGRYPNRLMDYPLLKTRVLHWANYLTGTSGYLHWGFNFWDVPFDQFSPGDNEIVWPGRDAPRSTLRYEAMREGIEDYEYLRLLEDAAAAVARRQGRRDFSARDYTLAFCKRVMPAIQDYSRDPEVLYRTRDAIARRVEALRRRDAHLD